MNKNDLIFDWSSVEAHRGWKGAAVLIVTLIFGFFISLVNVEFDSKEVVSVKSASVLYLPDHEEGRIWRMKAEEEGPFPGRLEISGMDDPFEELASGVLNKDDSWNLYKTSMRPLEMESVKSMHRISVQGQRYLPKIFKSTGVVIDQQKSEVLLKPLLIPYTKESEKWLPTEYPPFRMEMKEEMDSSEWRFVLNLSADGKVKECLSLSGGDEVGLAEITEWLKGLLFQEVADQERWMGLRIEILNERSHGSDPK
jgi:hypothetical protein